MKKFEFPLARALEWRRTRVTMEEAALGRLQRELGGLEARVAQARAEQSGAALAPRASSIVTGAELAARETFRRFMAGECARLEGLASGCRQRIAAQMQTVTAAQREVRLLERLHQRRFNAWQGELFKEMDREASELYLANFGRS